MPSEVEVLLLSCHSEYIQGILKGYVFYNSAELGGGVYAILQDSSINNFIHFTQVTLFNNTAHRGGGMFVHIQDTTAANRV